MRGLDRKKERKKERERERERERATEQKGDFYCPPSVHLSKSETGGKRKEREDFVYLRKGKTRAAMA